MYSIIDPELYLKSSKRKRFNQNKVPIRQYFGCEDLIINTAARVHDNMREEGEFSFAHNGFRM